jgi:hypothetical protein
VSRPVAVDLAEVRRRLAAVEQLRRDQGAAEHRDAVERMAASARLRWMGQETAQGARTSREAASAPTETASTTTTHAGGLSGCSTQSA